MTFHEKTVIVDGKKVRYFRSTTGRKTTERPILMLHGFMSDATSLLEFAHNLGEDRDVIIPDLPGFGESESIGEHAQLRSYVEWTDHFIAALAVTPCTYIGYSFGAYIAILYVNKYTVATDAKLILMTPVIRISWRVRVYGRGFRFAAIKSRKLAERLYLVQYDLTTRYLRKSKHPSTRAQLIERRREELAFLQPELVLRLFSEFLELDIMRYAAKLKQPTIVVLASEDNVAANGATRQFSFNIKCRTSVIEVRHSGHLLPIEEPAVAAMSIRSYL